MISTEEKYHKTEEKASQIMFVWISKGKYRTNGSFGGPLSERMNDPLVFVRIWSEGVVIHS